jgi:transposase InsO family protein
MRKIARGKTRATGRRGFLRQASSRTADRTLWRSTVRAVRWLSLRGHPERDAILRIGLKPRTVRGWGERWREERLKLRPRGRPVERPDRDLRNAILSLFGLVGPDVAEETLSDFFPEVSRAELRELKRRYRAVWRRKGAQFVSALRWISPGSVWATDFTHPPLPVDGIFPAILPVRDLPSAKQLAALPVPDETARTARDCLAALIKEHGAPLVLKMDNGSAFQAEAMQDLLEEHGILPLHSPPYTPKYNGAVETGNGTLKTHAHYASAVNDRPGEWTCDDVEAGRLRGNALSRPHGRDRPTPDEAWERRIGITEAERTRFQEVYQEEHRKELAARGILPLIGPSKKEKDTIDRTAISKALIRCRYLIIRRRRITPPVSQRKAARIS